VRSVLTGSFSQRVMIGELSDKVILSIFYYYLVASPRHWPRLAHVCASWRRIVFTSQRALHLRLFCTHGTPVLKSLDIWPDLPMVVEYGKYPGLNPPGPEDEDDIMAALKQSDRVCSISLTITSSLLENLSSIEGPFSELEDLMLLSRDSVRLTLPSTFLWGPSLRRLHLTKITCPALLQLLYTSGDLVDIQLHDAIHPWHFSPEALAKALSRMDQLRSFSLHFHTTDSYIAPPPPSGERVLLPVLTRLNFRGPAEYMERLVARIDAPCLADVEVAFFNTPIFDISNLSGFIDRTEMHRSHSRACILSSERAISISFVQSGTPTRLELHVLCEPLNVQLSYIAEICLHFSAFLFNVEDLRINTTRLSSLADNHSGGGWLELINSFTAVLPALHELSILQPGPRHAPLREAVASFMTSRRLSGQPIKVEYERLCDISELRDAGTLYYNPSNHQHFTNSFEAGPYPQQVGIETLSDDILLNIFRHCMDATPRFWPTLSWVCGRWRQIIFTSPLGLNLRLCCTYGTPVLRTLDIWPALPIIVQYGGLPNLDRPSPADEDNIIAALKQSGRVRSISLTVTSSLNEKLSAITEPFLELEELALLSLDNTQLTLPGTFRWGSRLRALHSTRITFPALPELLSPCHDLVNLQLHEIPSAGYISPEAFAGALSGMTRLEAVSLHFFSLPPRRNYVSLHPALGQRVALPALTNLKYRGTSKYLDSFVARIDAPHLGDVDITFFSQPTMDAAQLGRFIERIELQALLTQAEVQTSNHTISVSFNTSITSTPLRLQISCKQSDWQLSCMAQVCDQLSPFLFSVKKLGINVTESSSGQDSVGGEQWPELIRAFGDTRDLHVAGVHVSDVLCALRPADGLHTTDITVLSALRILRVEESMKLDGPSWDAVQSFVTSRWLSGPPVQMYARECSCHICGYTSFRGQQLLKTHLVTEHAYRIVCSYCGGFEWSLGYDRLSFREHLKNKHPEVARNDPIISNTLLTSLTSHFHHDSLLNWHGSLRTPDMVARSTTIAAPLSQELEILTPEEIPARANETPTLSEPFPSSL
jgi:hypothetical protein